MVAFSVPGALVMTVASGFLFGTLLGAACSVAGATLGAIAVFLVARTALGDLLRHRTGSALARMRAGLQENAINYLLVLRLVPPFPFWLVNLVTAFRGVSMQDRSEERRVRNEGAGTGRSRGARDQNKKKKQ